MSQDLTRVQKKYESDGYIFQTNLIDTNKLKLVSLELSLTDDNGGAIWGKDKDGELFLLLAHYKVNVIKYEADSISSLYGLEFAKEFNNRYIKINNNNKKEIVDKLDKLGYPTTDSSILTKPYSCYVIRNGFLLGCDGYINFDEHLDTELSIKDLDNEINRKE